MIKDCSLNLECKVYSILDLSIGLDYIIIGEIVESYAEAKYLTDGKLDIEKMKPIVMSMYENKYFEIGIYLGKCWDYGKDFKPK